jgi:hypothetical protein
MRWYARVRPGRSEDLASAQCSDRRGSLRVSVATGTPSNCETSSSVMSRSLPSKALTGRSEGRVPFTVAARSLLDASGMDPSQIVCSI